MADGNVPKGLAGLVHVATSVAVDIVEQCPEELHPQLFPAVSGLPQAAVQVRCIQLAARNKAVRRRALATHDAQHGGMSISIHRVFCYT